MLRKVLSALFILFGAVSLAASAADIDRGQELYAQFCQRCHGVDGYRSMPQAADLARTGVLPLSNRKLEQRIQRGSGLCPSYRGLITDRDLTNLIVFIRTLR